MRTSVADISSRPGADALRSQQQPLSAEKPPNAAPRVSIGMPVHNGADYLQAAIESVLAQTFADFEFIICDNASSDATRKICERAALQDGRVRYIRHRRNQGAAANYNRAFREARGEYFKWAAHDDVLARDHLARCIEILDSDPGCILVHPATVEIDELGRETACYLDFLSCDSEKPWRRFAQWMSRNGRCNPVFGLVRRHVMAETCLHGDYMGADHVFLAEIALRGRVRMLREPLFFRRIHPAMSTTKHKDAAGLHFWYTGQNLRGLRFKRWGQLKHFIPLLNRVELSWADRARCYAILLLWVARRRRVLLRELATIGPHVNDRLAALRHRIERRFISLRANLSELL